MTYAKSIKASLSRKRWPRPSTLSRVRTRPRAMLRCTLPTERESDEESIDDALLALENDNVGALHIRDLDLRGTEARDRSLARLLHVAAYVASSPSPRRIMEMCRWACETGNERVGGSPSRFTGRPRHRAAAVQSVPFSELTFASCQEHATRTFRTAT